MRGGLRDRILHLSQWRDVIEDPKPSAMRPNAQVIAFDNEIANRSRAHIQPQRLPVLTVIERNMNGALCAGKQQTLSFRILAHDVGIFVRWNTIRDLSPVRATIARAVDMWMKIVKPQSIDRCVSSVLIEVTGIDNRNLLPGL